jgi:hypothetical protein
MLRGHRHLMEDDQGDMTEDFEGLDVVRKSSRVLPFNDTTPSGRRRLAKLYAIRILRAAGMKPADIALAVEHSERWVWKRSALLREVAEAHGRV